MTKHTFLIEVTVEGPEAAHCTAEVIANFIHGEVAEQLVEIDTYGVTNVVGYGVKVVKEADAD